MNRGLKIVEKIKKYFNDARNNYPEITDSDLDAGGAIYYMNGNDGTNFDWYANNRCCEFFIFYKKSELGFIKVFLNSDDTLTGYLYLDEGKAKAIVLKSVELSKGDSLYFASLLQIEADDKRIWDEKISEIDFSRELEDCQLFADED